MKAKRGYKELKHKFSTGKWLKRYFQKRTVRKFIKRIHKMEDIPDGTNKLVDENFWELKSLIGRK